MQNSGKLADSRGVKEEAPPKDEGVDALVGDEELEFDGLIAGGLVLNDAYSPPP